MKMLYYISFILILCSHLHAEDELDIMVKETLENNIIQEDLSKKEEPKTDPIGGEEFQVDETDENAKQENQTAEEVMKHEDITLPSSEEDQSNSDEERYTDFAWLQALNKITARISSFKIPVGMNYKFGNLDIHVKKCWKSSGYARPENKALLRVWQQKAGEDRKEIFYGWMFSSNPAISSLENPVYDLTVVECVKK